MFSATDAASATSAQVQVASTTKTLETSKQEEKVAVEQAQTSHEGTEIDSTPDATGSVIDVQA